MSTGDLKSINKMRELCADVKSMDFASVGCDAVLEIAEEIEQEIAERYIELPVDADGMPIKPGDMMESEVSKNKRVWMVCSTGFAVYGDPGGYNPEAFKHVKPRTIEDVLEEFGKRYIWAVETPEPIVGFGNEIVGEQDPRDVIAKYADELRSMGVSE